MTHAVPRPRRRAPRTAAKALGDLPPIIADLVPATPVRTRNELTLASPARLQARAVEKFNATRRRAISGMMILLVITIVVWFAIGWGANGWHASFPRPLFVVLGTGINVLRVLLHKQDIIEGERPRLELKQRKALEAPGPDAQA